MLGLIGWGIALAVPFAYQGLGLVSTKDRWPPFSELLRVIMRYPVGRWGLFGLWLWVGWHVFVRGWHFFLRA